MKRIAIFSIAYDPFIGGAEIAIKEITKRLGSEFEFDLFTARFDNSLPKEEKIGSVRVFRVGVGAKFFNKIFYPFVACRLASKLNKENPYFACHAFLETYAGVGALFFKIRHKSVPYILTMQSGDSDIFIFLRTWFWYPLYRMIFSKADKIVAISDWLAKRALKYYYNARPIIIPNGVDFEKFNASLPADEKATIKNSWSVRQNDFIVFTSSRLVYKNGIDVLIDSAAFLPREVKIVIAGTGPLEKELKKRAQKFKDKIVFLGHINADDIPKMLHSSDVFARISRTEGFGNSFIEAMAAQIPVVATQTGGIVDFVKNGETGVFASCENPKSVAEAIMRIKSDKEFSNKLSKNGTILAKEKYDWNGIAEKYREIYNSLLIDKTCIK